MYFDFNECKRVLSALDEHCWTRLHAQSGSAAADTGCLAWWRSELALNDRKRCDDQLES